MKKLYFVLASLAIFSMVLTLTNCKEEPVELTKQEKLVDKWWYNLDNQGRGDHFFGSDNTLEMTWPAPTTGTYTWGPNDSMYVNIPGSAPFTLWFKTVEEDYMEYWPTFEPESNIYKFSTTKP